MWSQRGRHFTLIYYYGADQGGYRTVLLIGSVTVFVTFTGSHSTTKRVRTDSETGKQGRGVGTSGRQVPYPTSVGRPEGQGSL